MNGSGPWYSSNPSSYSGGRAVLFAECLFARQLVFHVDPQTVDLVETSAEGIMVMEAMPTALATHGMEANEESGTDKDGACFLHVR